MAVLQYHQIRSLPGRTINYIANGNKMVSPLCHDVHTILSCMSEPAGIERVYPLTRHCSPTPMLAAPQMDLYRAKYRESKYGDSVPGLKKGSPELLGLHFIISYTEQDDPSEAVMNAITTALAEHPRLRDFPMYSANHFNTHHSSYTLCPAYPYGFPAKVAVFLRNSFLYRSFTKYIGLRTSQANGHIGRDTEDIVLDCQISRMDDIALANPILELFPEPQQGFNGVICAGFHLNGIHPVLGLAVVGNDKINFNIVSPFFLIVMGIEEQPMTIGGQHLGNHVFI